MLPLCRRVPFSVTPSRLANGPVVLVSHVLTAHDIDDFFGDVGRVVANPLKIPRDQDQRQGSLRSQGIGDNAGKQCSEDFIAEPVRTDIFLQHGLGQLAVTAVHRRHRVRDHLAGKVAEFLNQAYWIAGRKLQHEMRA